MKIVQEGNWKQNDSKFKGNNLSSVYLEFLLDVNKIIMPYYLFYLSNITMRVSPTQGILNAGHECIRPCTCLYLVSAV